MNAGSAARLLGFKTCFLPFLAEGSWRSRLTFLRLSFLTYKVEIIIHLPHRAIVLSWEQFCLQGTLECLETFLIVRIGGECYQYLADRGQMLLNILQDIPQDSFHSRELSSPNCRQHRDWETLLTGLLWSTWYMSPSPHLIIKIPSIPWPLAPLFKILLSSVLHPITATKILMKSRISSHLRPSSIPNLSSSVPTPEQTVGSSLPGLGIFLYVSSVSIAMPGTWWVPSECLLDQLEIHTLLNYQIIHSNTLTGTNPQKIAQR